MFGDQLRVELKKIRANFLEDIRPIAGRASVVEQDFARCLEIWREVRGFSLHLDDIWDTRSLRTAISKGHWGRPKPQSALPLIEKWMLELHDELSDLLKQIYDYQVDYNSESSALLDQAQDRWFVLENQATQEEVDHLYEAYDWIQGQQEYLYEEFMGLGRRTPKEQLGRVLKELSEAPVSERELTEPVQRRVRKLSE